MSQRIEVRGAARVEGARARQVLARLAWRDPGRQIHERREVAAVERQFLDGPFLDHRADLGGVGAHEWCARRDRGGLFDAADLERRIHAQPIIDLKDDPAVHPLSEALELHRHGVGAGNEERRGEVAVGVADDGHRRALVQVFDAHLRARDWLACRVGHRANDAAGGDLCVDLDGTRDRRENHQHECRRRASHRDQTHGCLPRCRAAHEEPRRPPEPGDENSTSGGSSRGRRNARTSDAGPMLAPRHSARWRTCGANAMTGAGRLSSAAHDVRGAALPGLLSAGLKPCPTCLRSR